MNAELELDVFLTDILLFTLKRQDVKKAFLFEAEMFGHENRESKALYKETLEVLIKHFRKKEAQL